MESWSCHAHATLCFQVWGDIIPADTDAAGIALGATAQTGLNWDANGKSFMVSPGVNMRYCRFVKPGQYFTIETTEGGQSPATVLADLNDQNSFQDQAYLDMAGR